MKPVITMIGDVFAFDRLRVLRALVLSVLASLLEGAGLTLLVPILGYAIGGGDVQTGRELLGWQVPYAALVSAALVVFIGVALLAVWFNWRRGVIVSALRRDFVADLSKRAQAGILRMGPEHAAKHDRIASTHMLTTDVEMAGQAVQFLFTTAGQVLRIPALAMVIFALSPGTGLTALAILILAVGLARPFDRRAKASGAALIEKGSHLLGRADESLASAVLIKTHKAEDRWISAHADAVDARAQVQHALVADQASARAVAMASGVIGVALVAWVALVLLDTELAQTAVMVFALSRLLPAAVQFHAAWRSALAALPSHARVNAMIKTAAQTREAPVPPDPGSGAASLALHNVAISRLADAAPVLPDASLDLAAGTLTVIMGRSGAGKSTLALGLSGVLPLQGGQVELDHSPLATDQRLALRRAAVLCPQDPVLLNDTLATNLRLADATASDEALWQALRAACAEDFVRHLPQGLNTLIGDRGARLSGGERQRIALATALLAHPRLLVLDEATSALDAATEDAVMTAILALRPGSTVVMVSHRNDIARRADQVVVLKDGRIIETAAWDQIAQRGTQWTNL